MRNEWGNAVYPMVPGHEIVGRVTDVGALSVYFGETDQVISWQTDHRISWRTVAGNAVEACTKIVI
ncbi:MAG: hypothetical protein ACRYFL_06950 [Janthinobacterium lividum]